MDRHLEVSKSLHLRCFDGERSYAWTRINFDMFANQMLLMLTCIPRATRLLIDEVYVIQIDIHPYRWMQHCLTKYLTSSFHWEGTSSTLRTYTALGYLKALLDNGWSSKSGINIHVHVSLNLMFEIHESRFKWKCGTSIGVNFHLTPKTMGGEKGKNLFLRWNDTPWKKSLKLTVNYMIM